MPDQFQIRGAFCKTKIFVHNQGANVNFAAGRVNIWRIMFSCATRSLGGKAIFQGSLMFYKELCTPIIKILQILYRHGFLHTLPRSAVIGSLLFSLSRLPLFTIGRLQSKNTVGHIYSIFPAGSLLLRPDCGAPLLSLAFRPPVSGHILLNSPAV